ncbi:MAG: small multi-drug export protein [Candidatus Woesearchaeota archaeon]
MNNLLNVILLSIIPISELRGAIPLGILNGLSWELVFIVATISNIAIIPIIFLFLDYLHKHFSKSKYYKYVFNKLVNRTRKKIEHKIGTKWELPALLLLVAIPLPGTGAYTGTLAAWLFNIERKRALVTIMLGVLIAAIITTLVTLGAISFF